MIMIWYRRFVGVRPEEDSAWPNVNAFSVEHLKPHQMQTGLTGQNVLVQVERSLSLSTRRRDLDEDGPRLLPQRP